MKFGYENLETDELLNESKAIAKVLMERLGSDGIEKEDADIIEALISVFNLDDVKRRYNLEIGTDGRSFYLEWHTPEDSSYKSYETLDDKPCIPDESLLKRAPVKWLENLLLGVYEVKQESY